MKRMAEDNFEFMVKNSPKISKDANMPGLIEKWNRVYDIRQKQEPAKHGVMDAGNKTNDGGSSDGSKKEGRGKKGGDDKGKAKSKKGRKKSSLKKAGAEDAESVHGGFIAGNTEGGAIPPLVPHGIRI
ncbi:MAG TPA: hypothetical protein PKM65_20260 [Spirochaetota bacterium]|nr:hypothetical protein [Spirochaetota bacterium]